MASSTNSATRTTGSSKSDPVVATKKNAIPSGSHLPQYRSHNKPNTLQDNIHDKICWQMASISNFNSVKYLHFEFEKMYTKNLISQVWRIKKKLNLNLLH
jgi:hypothetical protein